MKEFCAVPLHKSTWHNLRAILESKNVGCIYCQRIYPAREITQWADQMVYPERNGTAKCAHCGIDAVLPDSQVELSARLLRRLHRYWF